MEYFRRVQMPAYYNDQCHMWITMYHQHSYNVLHVSDMATKILAYIH